MGLNPGRLSGENLSRALPVGSIEAIAPPCFMARVLSGGGLKKGLIKRIKSSINSTKNAIILTCAFPFIHVATYMMEGEDGMGERGGGAPQQDSGRLHVSCSVGWNSNFGLCYVAYIILTVGLNSNY